MRNRGKNFDRMNDKQKAKVIKTQSRMKKVRVEDNGKLREEIKAKLVWALEQKQVGLNAITQYQKHIQTNTQELFKLDGSILVLTQLLEEKPKKRTKKTKKDR